MARRKKKKKKKRAEEKGSPPPAEEDTAPSPRPWWKKRLLWAGVAGFIVLGGFLLLASTLPGYEDPNEDRHRCFTRISRISTACLFWARSHSGNLPDDLGILQSGGGLPEDPSLWTCPSSGKPYRFQSGIRRDMPGSTVLISCPEESSHRYAPRDPTADTGHIIHYIGADLRFHYKAVKEETSPAVAEMAVRRAFRRTLKDQRDALALIERVKAGNREARDELVRFSRAGFRTSASRALAVWGMGESGDKTFIPFLASGLQRIHSISEPFELALAQSLLRLGDTQSVPHLIETLRHEDSSIREAARDILETAFREASPPIPDFKPYAPEPFRGEGVRRWREWWKAYSGK